MATIKWVGGKSNKWNDKENWSPKAVPTGVDDVIIENGTIELPKSSKKKPISLSSLTILHTGGKTTTLITPKGSGLYLNLIPKRNRRKKTEKGGIYINDIRARIIVDGEIVIKSRDIAGVKKPTVLFFYNAGRILSNGRNITIDSRYFNNTGSIVSKGKKNSKKGGGNIRITALGGNFANSGVIQAANGANNKKGGDITIISSHRIIITGQVISGAGSTKSNGVGTRGGNITIKGKHVIIQGRTRAGDGGRRTSKIGGVAAFGGGPGGSVRIINLGKTPAILDTSKIIRGKGGKGYNDTNPKKPFRGNSGGKRINRKNIRKKHHKVLPPDPPGPFDDRVSVMERAFVKF